MKIAICNPMNVSETKHSRKGMYVPLGILSIATLIKQELKDSVEVVVLDEDVTPIDPDDLAAYDLVGFYATTFNYATSVDYAKAAKKHGCTTILGGPHPSVLAENIANNQDCFDYIIRFEAEFPFLDLVTWVLEKKGGAPTHIPNLVFRREGGVFVNEKIRENTLHDLPNPSREFIDFDLYIRNFREAYPDRPDMRQASIYSSKGCSWRDKTGGCIFCARLEKGVRFRPIKSIWEEIEDLYDNYGANCIWDISDDNLNNFKWFKEFCGLQAQKIGRPGILCLQPGHGHQAGGFEVPEKAERGGSVSGSGIRRHRNFEEMLQRSDPQDFHARSNSSKGSGNQVFPQLYPWVARRDGKKHARNL